MISLLHVYADSFVKYVHSVSSEFNKCTSMSCMSHLEFIFSCEFLQYKTREMNASTIPTFFTAVRTTCFLYEPTSYHQSLRLTWIRKLVFLLTNTYLTYNNTSYSQWIRKDTHIISKPLIIVYYIVASLQWWKWVFTKKSALIP